MRTKLASAATAALLATVFLSPPIGAQGKKLSISSFAYGEGGAIPKKYTCEGANVSPPLQWSSPPNGTKSFALVIEDPDAPNGTFVHWVTWNLPVSTTSLSEGASKSGLPDGTQQGVNGSGSKGFTGPCPPQGRHRYFHRLFALDTMLDGVGKGTRADLDRAMKDHVLATATLMATYEKSGK